MDLFQENSFEVCHLQNIGDFSPNTICQGPVFGQKLTDSCLNDFFFGPANDTWSREPLYDMHIHQ